MEKETRKPSEQIVKIGIGGAHNWPIFSIDISDKPFKKRQTNLFYLFDAVFGTTDLKTMKKNLLKASKNTEGIPAEAAQYISFKFFEETTNQLFSAFRKTPGNEKIDELIESNSDHGYSHQRRLEKLLKEFFKNEPGYRRNSNLLFFILPQLISIRFHDIFELFPDGKKFHTEGGALLALGFLNQNREGFNQIVESMGIEKPGDDTWSKIVISTLTTCLYHSKPKLLENIHNNVQGKDKISINDLLTNEFNLPQALNELKEKHQNRQNLVNLMINGSDFIKKNKNKTIFTFKEVNDLITSAKVFGAVDKLDSVLPAELSTARTFITMKDNSRPFFALIEDIIYDDYGEIKDEILRSESPYCRKAVDKIRKNKLLDYQDEYYLRLTLSEGHTSPDDFSRFLFETQRVDFYNLPEWLMAGFKFALEEKGNFLAAMVPEILSSGNIKIFQSVYLQAEAGLLVEFLTKHGIPEPEINNLTSSFLEIEDQTERDRYVSLEAEKILNQYKIQSDSNYLVNLTALRNEQSELNRILKNKTDQLEERGLRNDFVAKRAKDLLAYAVRKRRLPEVNSSIFTKSKSYSSYYPISLAR